MSDSIKFDSTEILNGTYLPRYIRHESAPPRELALMELAKENGAVLVSEKYGIKYITVVGKLTAVSRSALDTAIDAFKLLFSGKEKNLDISWEGGTRRYVATCSRHNFDRDHYHNLFIPWSAEFVVASGIGEATSETTLVNAATFTPSSDYDQNLTFLGSARPQPRFTIKIVAGSTDAKGVQVKNGDTGEKMIMTRATGFGAGKDFEFDCRLKTTKYDGTEQIFYGVFPKFVAGINNIEIKIGRILDQEFDGEVYNNQYLIYDSNRATQSFTLPHGDATYQGIGLWLDKNGTPPTNLVVRIETDSNGAPSGTLAHANSHGLIGAGDAVGAWYHEETQVFALSANTRYWLVLDSVGGSVSNCYLWAYNEGSVATYKRGNAAQGSGTPISWTDEPDKDMNFRLYYGGLAISTQTTVSVYYYKRYL